MKTHGMHAQGVKERHQLPHVVVRGCIPATVRRPCLSSKYAPEVSISSNRVVNALINTRVTLTSRQFGEDRPALRGQLLEGGTRTVQLGYVELQPGRVAAPVSLVELRCAVLEDGEALVDAHRTADDAVTEEDAGSPPRTRRHP